MKRRRNRISLDKMMKHKLFETFVKTQTATLNQKVVEQASKRQAGQITEKEYQEIKDNLHKKTMDDRKQMKDKLLSFKKEK